MTAEDKQKYTLFLRAVQKAIDEIKPPSTVMCSVLAKLILAELTQKVGLEEAEKRFHDGVDESVDRLKQVYRENGLL